MLVFTSLQAKNVVQTCCHSTVNKEAGTLEMAKHSPNTPGFYTCSHYTMPAPASQRLPIALPCNLSQANLSHDWHVCKGAVGNSRGGNKMGASLLDAALLHRLQSCSIGSGEAAQTRIPTDYQKPHSHLQLSSVQYPLIIQLYYDSSQFGYSVQCD